MKKNTLWKESNRSSRIDTDNIFFAKISGRKNVVCFRSEASWIISDQWYHNSRSNADDEAKLIIKTAAKLIKSDTSLFYFKKHAFKKHNAQNAKEFRNMDKKHSQAEI